MLFTGLIREIGEVISFKNELLEISSAMHPGIGDSIAVNGACLTVIKSSSDSFFVQVSHESFNNLSKNTFTGKVHLESALRVGDRLDGHFLQGHIDSLGVIKSINKNGDFFDIYIDVKKEIMKFMIPKGSVAIDGVSLTINESDIKNSAIRLTLIPHTFSNTIFTDYAPKREVNIETDILARTIIHSLEFRNESKGWEFYDRYNSIY